MIPKLVCYDICLIDKVSQIIRWRKNYRKINKYDQKSPTRVTNHPGLKLENPNLETIRITVEIKYMK